MVLESTPNYAPAWIMPLPLQCEILIIVINFLAKPYFEKYVEVAEVDKAKNMSKKT
ncbi:MAG: hypothetical protein U0T81_18505 [Saprospiraceae bacterium]